MRNILSQVGFSKRSGRGLASAEANTPPPPRMDRDVSEVMGCFASPKRFGHYGSITDVFALSYEAENGLIAIASRGGLVKVSGALGVELIVEEEGAIAGDDSPAHLLFASADLLAGVTTLGGVYAWDLVEGNRCGYLPPPPVSAESGVEERVTAVNCVGPFMDAPPNGSKMSADRYVLVGFESGSVRVSQVLSLCRASGYVVEPEDVVSGIPAGLRDPHGGGRLGAVTAIACTRDGERAAFGYRYGAVVLWDWIRRRRVLVCGLGRDGMLDGDSGGEDEAGREVTSLAFHPDEEVLAAGFGSGCYAVFPLSARNECASPRWVQEVGEDGSFPREGPTVVRTPVSFVQWVGVKGGDVRAWGLLVAGGIEMEEGEEPDGVSLLVPPSAPYGADDAAPPRKGGKLKAKDRIARALAPMETAVFIPFAIGQERLSHVHAVATGIRPGPTRASSGEQARKKDDVEDVGRHGQNDGRDGSTAREVVDVSEELHVIGLVTWNDEVRGPTGRLHFRRASQVQACPIQTSPYVALLQLASQRIGTGLSGFAAVTAVASTPLLSSCAIRDFAASLNGSVGASDVSRKAKRSPLLRGGALEWTQSVAPDARDEDLSISEMLVAGHNDGLLTLWECCGPVPRQDGVLIEDGRVSMREIPSGAAFLGCVTASELMGSEGSEAAVTALDVWLERDHVAKTQRNACWVAVGFGTGEAAVFLLSSGMDATEGGADGRETSCAGAIPLAGKPVEVSDVQLAKGLDEQRDHENARREKQWKKLLRAGSGPMASSAPSEGQVDGDAELEAAIAEARAEAREIEARGEDGEDEVGEIEPNAGVEAGQGLAGESAIEVEGHEQQQQQEQRQEQQEQQEKEQQEDSDEVDLPVETPESSLRQELAEAMEEHATWSAPVPKYPSTASCAHEDIERDNFADDERSGVPRRGSLTQLVLRFHSHAVRCVGLCFDPVASALVLAVADGEGVVSVTDVSTGSASLLPMRAPQVRPCCPSITIGPLPPVLCDRDMRSSGRGSSPRGAAGALFVFLEGWLNVFDIASRDPVDLVQVPGIAGEAGAGARTSDAHDTHGFRPWPAGTIPREESGPAWMRCVDRYGVPLDPYASDPLTLSSADSPAQREPSRTDAGLRQAQDSPHDGGQESVARTVWVSPPPSRLAGDSYDEYELQAFSPNPPHQFFLLVVRGAVAIVLAFSRSNPVTGASRQGDTAADPRVVVAAFKGRPSVEAVVKARVELPPIEGGASGPTVERAGVCLVAAGKARHRGCLVATDSSGFVTGLLLPSLSPVFRDRLPGDGAEWHSRAVVVCQHLACNMIGELWIPGPSGELTRWSLLTDEAIDRLMSSKPRLIKVSKLVKPSAMSDGRQAMADRSGGSGRSAVGPPANGKSSKGMLGRISLGGGKRSLGDVFAVEPAPVQFAGARRQSSGGRVHSVSSTASASSRRGTGRDDARADSDAQRHDLFGDRKASSDAASVGHRDGTGAGKAFAAASEARDLALERGEKLESMVDKSRQLEDSAMAFGDMAKQLRKQQEEEACSVS